QGGDKLFTGNRVKRLMIVKTTGDALGWEVVRAGVGVSVVNQLTAVDYAESGLVVRRFSIAVPFTVSLIRPLHRPSSALVQAFSEHLQAGLPKLVTSLDAILSSATTA
ncbi:LysR substrate-binding domain-containing protein, partial [Escherichia coli]